MTRMTVHEYAASLRPRYRAAGKKGKTKILDEFCQTTGLHRKAAIRLLNQQVQPRSPRRGRPRLYGPEAVAALKVVWETADRMCGKLLAAVMAELIASLERHGELQLNDETRALVLSMSAATIDRLLKRRLLHPSQVHRHKPPAAQSLKAQVPLKTWS